MKPFPALCALLAALCALPLAAADKKAASGKKDAAPGHLLYVNTVGDRGWSFFVMDGEDIRPSGIETGFRSSWVSYPAGKRSLQFEHQPLGLIDLEADLKTGGLHAFVVYSDFVGQEERRRPPRPVLAVKELRCDLLVPPDRRKASHLVLLNLTHAPTLSIRVEGLTHEISRLQETVVKPPRRSGMAEVDVLPSPGLPTVRPVEPTAEPRTDADTQEAGGPVHSLKLNLEDAGNRFLIFYTDSQDSVQCLVFDDIGMYPDDSEE